MEQSEHKSSLKMEAIKNTVMNVMESLVSKKTGDSNESPQGWLKKALTKRQLEHIKINYFKKGVLSINIDSSSWLYSLTLQKEELLAKLNKISNGVKEIRFRIGEVKCKSQKQG